MKIEKIHKKLLEWTSIETGYYYDYIEGETGLSRKEISKGFLDLKIAGYVTLNPVVNCDGETAGRVHILTIKGEQLQSDLNIEYLGQSYAC